MNLPLLLFVFSVIAITFLTTAIKVYKRRPWLINYLKYRINHNPPLIASGSPTHIMFLFVDHFEPKENTKDPEWAEAIFPLPKRRAYRPPCS